MRFYVYLVCTLAMGGCAYVPPPPLENTVIPTQPTKPYSLTAENIMAVKTAVSSVMKDPFSSQFDKLRASQIGGKVTVCGEVNSRNGYGGYSGFSPFIVFLIPSRNVAAITDLAPNLSDDFMGREADLIARECAASGL